MWVILAILFYLLMVAVTSGLYVATRTPKEYFEKASYSWESRTRAYSEPEHLFAAMLWPLGLPLLLGAHAGYLFLEVSALLRGKDGEAGR